MKKIISEHDKLLIISPHADDEVLGCGGFMLKAKQVGAEQLIVYATIGGFCNAGSITDRENECNSLLHEVGAAHRVLITGMDAMLDTVPSVTLTTALDAVISSFKPSIVFLPYKSRHQDHVKVNECAIASLRLRDDWQPSMILQYEYPFVADEMNCFNPNLYIDISNTIEQKVELFNKYRSQIKPQPSPLN